MPEGRDYYAFLDGERMLGAVAANEEEGWVDHYLLVGPNRLKVPVEKVRSYGKVELRHK